MRDTDTKRTRPGGDTKDDRRRVQAVKAAPAAAALRRLALLIRHHGASLSA